MRGTLRTSPTRTRRRIGALLAIALVIPTAAILGAPSSAGAVPLLSIEPDTAVEVGPRSACATSASGALLCWGENGTGQLGDATTTDRPSPAPVSGLASGVIDVAIGYDHACALRSTGTVSCWGDRNYGQVGGTVESSPQLTPVAVAGLPKPAVSIAASAFTSCAALIDGTVWCWGGNSRGELGVGGSARATPAAVPGADEVDQLTAGYQFFCGHTADDGVVCWGANDERQAAPGSSSVVAATTKTSLAGTVRTVTAGEEHVCALTKGGGLTCWGGNDVGQLGDGTTTGRGTPATVNGLGANVLQADAGGSATCAVSINGATRCWGEGGRGVLGNATRSSSTTAAPVAGLSTGGRAVSVGASNACGLSATGEVRCWGANEAGALGTGATTSQRTPAVAPGLASPAWITVGGASGCALATAATVSCWGDNAFGQLGTGSTTDRAQPTVVSNVSSAAMVDAGEIHNCIATTGGAVRCWGANDDGQLGVGDTTSRSTATVVPGLTTVVEVSAGHNSSCARKTDGTVWCWGANYAGQLGDGTTTQRLSPVQVSGITTATDVTVGYQSACAILSDGTARCWGANTSGQLGNGNLISSSTPVTVTNVGDVTSIAVGSSFACAVAGPSDGVFCWGSNSAGQLGTGNTTSSATPTSASGLVGGVEVAAGSWSACARLAGGVVKCWGNNSKGQVGSGSTDDNVLAPATAMASGAIQVDMSSFAETVCARTATQGWCWGDVFDANGAVDPGWTPQLTTAGTQWNQARWAPLGSWSALVDQQYTDLIAASPSSTVRTDWVNDLTANSATPGDVVAALRLDPGQANVVDPTARLYFAYFLRIPDKGGLNYWIGKKRGGMLLRTISDNFAASNEFKRRYGSLTNRQFVELIYQNLFARAGDTAGVNYWTGKLDRRDESRGGVMANFSESNEYKRKMGSEVTTSVMNLLILQRQPTQADFDETVLRLDGGDVTTAGLADEMLRSSVYANRFD